MQRWFVYSVVASAIVSGGCHRKESAVCNIGPPDDPHYYQRWADDITAAHCKGMRVDQNAIVPTSKRTDTTMQAGKQNAKSVPLPFNNSTGILQGYSLTVAPGGQASWNGAPVSDATLKGYLHQWADRPRNAGGIFVAFAPGVTAGRSNWIRHQVRNAGLCAQRRCWEVRWNAKRQVVN